MAEWLSFMEKWGPRQWFSVCGIIMFSIVGTIIQMVFIIKLFKRRDHTVMQKHFVVRGKALFLAHCVLNFYWSSLHPIVIGLQYIYYPHHMIVLITSYCYTLVLLDSLMAIFCIRCWILYFNFNYLALQFEKLWKTKLLNQHYNLSWFEAHKSLGNPLFLMIIGFSISLLLCILTIPYAYVSQLSTAWQILFGAGVFLTDIFSVMLILKLHSRKSVDNYGMRHELTIFVLVMLAMTLITVTPFFIISDHWIRLWIITIPIYCSTLYVNIFQFDTILHEIEERNKFEQEEREHDYTEKVKLIEVLSDAIGINEFARFLIGEFSLEHLLFLIEVSQFRFQFEITTKGSTVNHKKFAFPSTELELTHEHKSDQASEDASISPKAPRRSPRSPRSPKEINYEKYEYRYQLSDTIPLCATILDNDDPLLQAKAIRDKFILRTSAFQVNISGTKRKDILDMDWINLTTTQLKHIFDATYNEVFVLLELDSFKRYLTTSPTASKLAKKILKKRRRARHRSKSKGNRIKKRVKEKNKQRERRHSASSIRLHPQTRGLRPTNSYSPNKMTKSISLNSGRNRSFSTPDGHEMAHSDNELDVRQDKGSTRADSPSAPDEPFVEERLADPFNSLSAASTLDKPRNSALERNIHVVLHSASSATTNKCCVC